MSSRAAHCPGAVLVACHLFAARLLLSSIVGRYRAAQSRTALSCGDQGPNWAGDGVRTLAR